MRASSSVWSVLLVELGLPGSYATQSTLAAHVDCSSGMSASSRPPSHATPPSDAHTEQHPLAACNGGEGGEGGCEDAGAANEQAPQAVWWVVAIISHALMRASSSVWSVLLVELGLPGSYATQSTLAAQVDCSSGMSASSRPPSHATPPSDAHTEQHSPADGGEGGSGGCEEEVPQQAPQSSFVDVCTDPINWHAGALAFPRPQSASYAQ